MTALRVVARSETTDDATFVTRFGAMAHALRTEPYKIGLMSPDAESLFLIMPWPVAREFWIAERAGREVGRIGASVSATEPSRGAVGFFEVAPADTQAASALLDRAEAWLREQGVLNVYGPMRYNTWFPYRFRVGGTDDLSYSWEPVHPREHPEMFKAAGYEPDVIFYSEDMTNLEAAMAHYEPKHKASVEAGYTYRFIDTGAGLEGEIPSLYDVSVRGFADNYLFEPITEPMFRMLYVAQAAKRKSVGSMCVEHPEHGMVGFAVSFEDEAGQFIGKSVVVVPEHRGAGLSHGLVFRLFQFASEAGYPGTISAMRKGSNLIGKLVRQSSIGWRHDYALFKKTL